MEFIRRNTDYALRALSYLAKFPLGRRFTIERIAQKHRMPVTFLRKIFQNLAKGKIVSSCLGSQGGFYLARNPSVITLREIIEAVQGEISVSDCLLNSDICQRIPGCRVRKRLSKVQEAFIASLDRATLKEIL